MIHRVKNIGAIVDLSTIMAISPIKEAELRSSRLYYFEVVLRNTSAPFAIGKEAMYGNTMTSFSEVKKWVEEAQVDLIQNWETWKKEQSSTRGTGTSSGESGEILRT